MNERCGLAALLSEGGPVRVSVRPCCLVALVGRRPSRSDPSADPLSATDSLSAVGPSPDGATGGLFACVAAEAEAVDDEAGAAELRVSS